MPWWTWLALGLFLAALVAGAVFAVFAFGRLQRIAEAAEGIEARLGELAAAGEALERRLAEVEARAAEVERHTARLEGSLERLGVLTWALRDARESVDRVRRDFLSK